MLVNPFKWKHYEGEIILLNVRYYLKYSLSFRNLKEMMAERGVIVLAKYYLVSLVPIPRTIRTTSWDFSTYDGCLS